MAISPYSGYTKRFSIAYKNKRIGQCTHGDGTLKCPSCRYTGYVVFIDEHVQQGFDGWDKYMEFNSCERCGYKFCIVMLRKDVVYVK